MTKQEAENWMNQWAAKACEVLNEKGQLVLSPGTKEYEDFKEAFMTLYGENN